MAEGGHGQAQGFVDEDLAGGVGHMVVTADDVGDAHLVVVHHHGHVVGGHAVGATDDHVVQLAHVHGDAALDHVIEHDLAGLGGLEAHAAAFAGAQVAFTAAAVVAGLQALGAGFFAHGFHFLGGAGAPVGVAGLQQLVHIAVVQLGALGLVVEGAVPVQSQPAHGSQDGVGVLLLGAQQVGVLDAQVELAAEVAGQQPAEDGGTRAADVQMARGAGRETGNDFIHGTVLHRRQAVEVILRSVCRGRAEPCPCGCKAGQDNPNTPALQWRAAHGERRASCASPAGGATAVRRSYRIFMPVPQGEDMSTQTVVIKYGGHAMDKDELNAAFADDMAFLQQSMRLVVVHGGGPQINALLNRLAIESRFEKGLRVTDADTMQAVEMVLCGQVNKSVVSRFLQHGARAAGLSGRDAGLLRARVKDPVLGLVGEVEKVDASVLACLLDGGFLPVVAPVASGPEGQALNINADTAAGAVAGALHADYFVLISDVPGVLDADKKLIPSLDRARIAELLEAGVINGGMIPKVQSCLHALDEGCSRALILDGRQPSSLRRYLLDGEPLGTVVTA